MIFHNRATEVLGCPHNNQGKIMDITTVPGTNAGRLIYLFLAMVLFVALAAINARAATFTNPLISNGADPWLEYYNGNYYLTTTTWNSQIVMRKSPTIAGLKTAAAVYVWSDTTASRCCNIWAPEIHRLNGPSGYRWYLMYSAGVSTDLGGQKNHVLESEGDDPMGPYRYRGNPLSSTWNIDGSYLEYGGSIYMLWSQWVGSYQTIFINKMSNPWTLSGSATAIATPTWSWEMVSSNVNEAPEIIQKNGRTFMSFSASSCNTPDYKLGLMELTGTNPLSASSWIKTASAVFSKANGVYGPGHNGFFTSPDGTEDWLVYHGNASSSQGCGDTRSTRVQKINWNSDGTPNLGSPVSTSTAVTVPSGETGPLTVVPKGASYQLVNRSSGLCLGISANSTSNSVATVLRACSAASSNWIVDSTANGYYRLVNANSGKVLDMTNCSTADGGIADQYSWVSNNCQQWQLANTSDGWIKLTNRNSGKVLDVMNCGTSENTAIDQWVALGNACQEWRLQPVGTVAIASALSGKVLDVAGCSTASGALVDQYEWLDTNCQKWTFTHADNGYYAVKPAHNTSMCMSVSNASSSTGAAIVQGTCGVTNSQWRLLPQSDGTLRFVARNSGLSLDVANCALANAASIDQYTWLDNICQRFQLRSAN